MHIYVNREKTELVQKGTKHTTCQVPVFISYPIDIKKNVLLFLCSDRKINDFE